jgi:hypothetical protein
MACYAYSVLTRWFSSVYCGAGSETALSKQSKQFASLASRLWSASLALQAEGESAGGGGRVNCDHDSIYLSQSPRAQCMLSPSEGPLVKGQQCMLSLRGLIQDGASGAPHALHCMQQGPHPG